MPTTFGVDLDLRPGRSPVDLMQNVAALLDQHHLVCVDDVVWSERDQLEATAVLGRLIGTVRGLAVVPNVRLERGADRYADRWHADLSWSTTPAVSVLLCIEAGPTPEPTEFTSTTAAVEAMTELERSDLVSRTVTHDLSESRRRRPASTPEPTQGGRPLRSIRRLARSIARRRTNHGMVVPPTGPGGQSQHPLIDRCPRTEAEFLRIGDHAWSISGMDPERSDAVLSALHGSVDDAPSWSVPWSPGRLVVYDNRMMLHRRAGVAGSDPGRVLRRTMAEWQGPLSD